MTKACKLNFRTNKIKHNGTFARGPVAKYVPQNASEEAAILEAKELQCIPISECGKAYECHGRCQEIKDGKEVLKCPYLADMGE